ncbi:hypothetical protein PIB30_066573 [Stylosanthes scabra]|uniref:Uncharacterized protein n=1 Tax=Stylosanthes scabra TaxID=79078 RepID=A0ABU6TM27_9FABA|nr:hypothetical protein [Stylosanthes scabra]
MKCCLSSCDEINHVEARVNVDIDSCVQAHVMLESQLPPVERVFFYDFPHQPSLFYDTILPKLKHFLSLALAYYFPLAGTLTWPHHSNKPIITYNVGDDTLSLIVAESDADFHHLSGSKLSGASEVHHLVPELTVSDDQATVLALQVTLFPTHGFSIGVTSHHAVLDGKTSTSFCEDSGTY